MSERLNRLQEAFAYRLRQRPQDEQGFMALLTAHGYKVEGPLAHSSDAEGLGDTESYLIRRPDGTGSPFQHHWPTEGAQWTKEELPRLFQDYGGRLTRWQCEHIPGTGYEATLRGEYRHTRRTAPDGRAHRVRLEAQGDTEQEAFQRLFEQALAHFDGKGQE